MSKVEWLHIPRLALTPRSLTRTLFIRMTAVMVFGALVIALVAETTVSSKIDQVFDQQLVLGANLLVNLMRDELQDMRKTAGNDVMEVDDMPLLSAEDREAFDVYANWRMFRIWYHGKLRLKSDTGPDLAVPLAASSSTFQIVHFHGEPWRIYTLSALDGDPIVQVGERLQVRHDLVSKIALQLAAPFILIALLLLLVIWVSLRTGLKDLDNFSAFLSHTRTQPPFTALKTESWPSELSDLVGVINGLFQRIEDGMRHERKFVDMAAHQLRTPLAGLSLEAQLCARTREPAELTERLAKLTAATQRIAKLVDQLLSLSRLSGLPAEPEREASCKTAISFILTDLAPIMAKNGIDIAIEGTDFAYRGADTAFSLVLSNLLENAMGHTPHEGEVTITLHPPTPTKDAIIEISDEGPGMNAHDKALAFDRFWRGNRSHLQGSGLGLAIAREAAENLGARLTLLDRPDGKSGLVARLDLTAAVALP
ncbi:sensor histidine kinase [Asticcacaulis benevestitus]|uniref:histidine kinase n=1 Tax=Asticcacaulis benevestitus DSM 16100 = ATCC BAA-896 TaxID=1121022 RepID=V4PQ47_9CAUL|nr:ATP-binding protein [Asticcacaulis benevestitus]ESQ87595.1 hypothetical protein ABENE_17160 [Asticcacaulis benevestitus DSM 16100 = ATCC BAA-896]